MQKLILECWLPSTLLKSSLGEDLVCISTPCYRVNFQVILKGKVIVIQKSMLQFSNSRWILIKSTLIPSVHHWSSQWVAVLKIQVQIIAVSNIQQGTHWKIPCRSWLLSSFTRGSVKPSDSTWSNPVTLCHSCQLYIVESFFPFRQK